MIVFESFEPFDLEGIGLTVDDLDLGPIDPLPAIRPRWSRQWWHDGTDDHPGFDTLEDRARHDIERYARPVLDRLGVSDDDAVFPYRGEMVSLNDLLAMFQPWQPKADLTRASMPEAGTCLFHPD